MNEILRVDGLRKEYPLPRMLPFGKAPRLVALDGVTFEVAAGRSLGIVGESGCGKSTLARLVMALEPATAGSVTMLGRDLGSLRPRELRDLRRDFQMVFQDPFGSLDPRSTVARIVGEPLEVLADVRNRAAMRETVRQTLESVGLRDADLDKYPHEFSGGQRQRIAVARALVTRPKLIVADEPVSALDVSIQAQVLNLLLDLREQYRLSYLLISHDLAVVEYVCDETVVMYRGRVVERAAAATLSAGAAHPYTRLLVDAVPRPGAVRRQVQADAVRDGADADWSDGCAFRTRCPNARERCEVETPALRGLESAHLVACHFPDTSNPARCF